MITPNKQPKIPPNQPHTQTLNPRNQTTSYPTNKKITLTNITYSQSPKPPQSHPTYMYAAYPHQKPPNSITHRHPALIPHTIPYNKKFRSQNNTKINEQIHPRKHRNPSSPNQNLKKTNSVKMSNPPYTPVNTSLPTTAPLAITISTQNYAHTLIPINTPTQSITHTTINNFLTSKHKTRPQNPTYRCSPIKPNEYTLQLPPALNPHALPHTENPPKNLQPTLQRYQQYRPYNRLLHKTFLSHTWKHISNRQPSTLPHQSHTSTLNSHAQAAEHPNVTRRILTRRKRNTHLLSPNHSSPTLNICHQYPCPYYHIHPQIVINPTYTFTHPRTHPILTCHCFTIKTNIFFSPKPTPYTISEYNNLNNPPQLYSYKYQTKASAHTYPVKHPHTTHTLTPHPPYYINAPYLPKQYILPTHPPPLLPYLNILPPNSLLFSYKIPHTPPHSTRHLTRNLKPHNYTYLQKPTKNLTLKTIYAHRPSPIIYSHTL